MRSVIVCAMLLGSVQAQRLDYNTICHLGVGMGIGSAAGVVGKNPYQIFFIGLAGGFVAGLGKEIYDAQKGNQAQFQDILATAVGGATSAMLSNLAIRKDRKRRRKSKLWLVKT